MDEQGLPPDARKIRVPDQPWFTMAEAALRNAGCGKVVEELRADLADLPNTPVVSVFGAYDAGKSTLLKRLLVEAGAEVPSWLTVSARRETFEVSAVEAFGCIFKDTPGIAAGSADHERQALEAVAGSDVIMLVMPPQLLTGDRDLTLALLSGKVFRPGGISMGGSSLVVIAKLDEGAVDPLEDPSAYADYVSRKRQEWTGLLIAGAVSAKAAPVYAVSADSFQRVGNDPSPSHGDYEDDFRAWDGISDLVCAIAELPDRLPALRQAAHARRVCWHLWKALDNVEAEQARIEDNQVEASQSQARLANFVRRLDALLGIARNELDRAVEEELLSFARRGDAEPEVVTERLDACIAQWERAQLCELDKLGRDCEIEIEVRERAQRVVAIPPKPISSSRVRLSIDQELVDGVTKHANNILDAYAKFRLNGKTLAFARERATNRSDPNEALGNSSKQAPKNSAQNPGQPHSGSVKADKQSPEPKATTAGQDKGEEPAVAALAKIEFGIQCAQALFNVGLILYGEAQKNQEAKQLERQRAAAREEVRRLGEQISREALTHFTQQAQVFVDWINSSKAQVESALASALADKANLEGAANGLHTALKCDAVPTA